MWSSTFAQTQQALPCASRCHAPANLPETFSKSEERLEAKTWLPLGWLWKVTYALQLHRIWKPESVCSHFLHQLGKLVWAALPQCPPTCAYSWPEESTVPIIDHSLNCICPDWCGGLEQRVNPSSCVLRSQGPHRSSTTSPAVSLWRLRAHFYHDGWFVHFFHQLAAVGLSTCPALHTCRLVQINLTDSTLLLLRLDEPRLSCCWVVRERSVGSELQAACAQLDIKSLVAKISSIKHVLEFYKSIKTEIVCVCVCSSGFQSPNFSSCSSTRSTYGFTTTPTKRSILLSGTELVCLWYRYMCAFTSV